MNTKRAAQPIAILIVSLILSLSYSAFGQIVGNGHKLNSLLRKYQLVQIDRQKFKEQVRKGSLTLQLPNRRLQVKDLEPNNLLHASYFAETSIGNGIRVPVSPISVNTYKGTIPESNNSTIRLTITEKGDVEGLFFQDKELYFIDSENRLDPNGNANRLVIYQADDVINNEQGSCGVPHVQGIKRAVEFLYSQAVTAEATTREVELATEADYEYVTAAGGATQANSLIASIINQVEGIYTQELGISFNIVYQHTWATADDPYTSTAAGTMLTEFRNYWNSNFSNIRRDLAHMWTGKDMDGSTVGIAYVGVVCRSASSSYGVSQRLTGQVSRVGLTAHEIGHNFSASHVTTSECTNTIMYPSLSSSLQLTFCQYSRDEINTHVTTYPSCLALVDSSPTPTPTPSPTPTPTPTGNLITNPGFEADNAIVDTITGWSSSSSSGFLDADGTWTPGSYAGNYFAYHWRNTNYDIWTYQRKTGLANGLYTLRAWVRSSGGQQEAQMGAVIDGGTRWLYVNIPPTWTWTQITLSNIPINNGACEVGFWSLAGTNQEIDFDNVEFFRQ
jgi:hypothetical protein